MHLIALVIVAFASFLADPALDAEQFSRMILGLHEDIKDVECVYEGEIKFPDAGKDSGKVKPQFFQGSYILRYDNARYLDVYIKTVNKPFSHDTDVVIANKWSQLNRIPDLGRRNANISPSYNQVLSRPCSAERFIFLAFWKEFRNLKDYGFEFQGWEIINGHKCAKIQVNLVSNNVRDASKSKKSRMPRLFLWVDLARGGHPLKVEFYLGDRIGYRSSALLASVVQPDGKAFWLPVSSTIEGFDFMNVNNLGALASVESYNLVVGSVRVNQNIINSRFDVNWNSGRPSTGSLKRVHEEFQKISVPDSPRTDAASVKERLDRNLAEADKQAEELKASSLASESVSSVWFLFYLFLAIAMLFLTIVAMLKLKERS